MFVLSTEESKERAEEVGSEHVNSPETVAIGACALARTGRTDAPGGSENREAKRRKEAAYEDDQDDVEELLGGLGIGSRE